MSRKKKESTNPHVIKLKIFFLLLLITAGYLMTNVIKKPGNIFAANTKLQSLSLAMPKLNDVKNMVDNLDVKSIQKTADNLKKQVLGISNSLVNQKASEAGSLATDFLFNKAINPILDQIHRLPKDQQNRLREEIGK